MNKRGQVFFFGLMLGLVIIVLAMALAKPIKDSVDEARNSNNLDCANQSISDFNKATCISSDMTIFYLLGGLLFIGGAVIISKLAG